MSANIRVDTVYHGSVVFDAANVEYFLLEEDGSMHLQDSDKDTFAIFAPGQWVFVAKVFNE